MKTFQDAGYALAAVSASAVVFRIMVNKGLVTREEADIAVPELPVDRPGGNCNVVVPVTFPEQHRTALLAEPCRRVIDVLALGTSHRPASDR